MQQPESPNALPPKTRSSLSLPSDTASTINPIKTQKKKLPTPQELISHYESQGLDSNSASIKVIEDLQRALFGVISSGRGRKDRIMAETSRKLDSVNNRLTIIDMKVDAKPGYAETFAIGIASGAALRGIGSVMPHVLKGLGQIWDSVTKSSPP